MHSRKPGEIFDTNIPTSILKSRTDFVECGIDGEATVVDPSLIAEGNDEIVYETVWNDESVAIKTISHDYEAALVVDADEYNSYILRTNIQINILQEFMPSRHPNIHRIYGYGIEKLSSVRTVAFFVSQLMPIGDLYAYKHYNNIPALSVRLQMAYEATSALTYIHHKGYVHGDVKSPNFLLNEDLRLKLTDFESMRLASVCHHFKGTVKWMAPEVFFKTAFASKASDVYSLATTINEIVSWNIPFKEHPKASRRNEEFSAAVRDEVHDAISSECPEGVARLITLGWMRQPAQRPSAKEVKAGLKTYKTRS